MKKIMSGCAAQSWTVQACKPDACPALWPKREPRVNDRDISGITGGGAYIYIYIWSQVLEQPPTPAPQQRVGRTWQQSSLLVGQGRLPVKGELSLVHYCQRNQKRDVLLTAPLTNYQSGDSSDLKICTAGARGRYTGIYCLGSMM